MRGIHFTEFHYTFPTTADLQNKQMLGNLNYVGCSTIEEDRLIKESNSNSYTEVYNYLPFFDTFIKLSSLLTWGEYLDKSPLYLSEAIYYDKQK